MDSNLFPPPPILPLQTTAYQELAPAGGNCSSNNSVGSADAKAVSCRLRKRMDTDDISSVGSDSMRPQVPPSKRRRRSLVDAFQVVNISAEFDTGNMAVFPDKCADQEEDADSSRAVARFSGGVSATSSLVDDDAYSMGNSDDASGISESHDPSERNIVLDLVFGQSPPKDPVDLKFQQWLKKQGHLSDASETQEAAVDDMHVDTSYSRAAARTETLTRSNSLPNMAADEDAMSIDCDI